LKTHDLIDIEDLFVKKPLKDRFVFEITAGLDEISELVLKGI